MSNIFTCRRLATDGISLISRWLDEAGNTLCYGLEPGRERPEHPGIPSGDYALRLRTVGAKHLEYQAYYGRRFRPGWHMGMVEIAGVPGRSAIEFHVGNTIADTEGCTLCGEAPLKPPGNGSGHWEVARSRIAYERVYPILRDAVLAGETRLRILGVGAPSGGADVA